MSYSHGHDIASEILTVNAAPKATATAAGTGDNTLVTGTALDTANLVSPDASNSPVRYNSVAFVLNATTTLTAAATLTVTGLVETSDVSNFASGVQTLVASATVLTIAGGAGGTFTGVCKIKADLRNALRYVRVKFTPDLSAGSADVSDIASLAIFGHPQELP